MKNLFATDYVLYDKANDHVVTDSNSDIIIYGNKHDATNDCYGNEYVLPCTELPIHWKEKLINQLNKN